MSLRTRASISPRQSPSALILASISFEGAAPLFAAFEAVSVFLVVAFFMTVARASIEYRHLIARAERCVTWERLRGCPSFRRGSPGYLLFGAP